MLKLMKYEMRKTMVVKLVLFGLAVVVEAFFLSMLSKGNPEKEGIAITLLVLLGLFGIIFMGVQSILTLHRDMNTRQGYMLFMTPNSSYRILGAKLLEAALATVIAAAFFFALGYLDVRLLLSQNQSVDETLSFLKEIVTSMESSIKFDLQGILRFVIVMLCSWLYTLSLGYLASVLGSSLLNGKRGGMLICFLLFVALDYVVSKAMGFIPNLTPEWVDEAVKCGCYLVVALITYIATAKLMDRHLSV